ncbi:RAD51-associated protein 1 [Mantella aurantiaca]
MAKNKKSIDYSQFLDLENDDEDFTPSVPVSKKSRLETKKEKKEKVPQKPKEETVSPMNSQSKRLPVDEKIYQRDLEVALALSVQETSVIIENNENTSRTVSPAFFPDESKDPEVSFSNCSVDGSFLGLDEITESNQEPVNGRIRRQAASKAITEQRKLLKEDDSGGEDDPDEFKPDSAVYEDSDSDDSYSGDDEEFEFKKSTKAATSKVPKAKEEKRGKNTPKAQRKDGDSENDSGDEEFEVKKSKKRAASKCPKAKNAKKENHVPLSKPASISSPASVSIKIKPMTAKHVASHSSPTAGMKRPVWSPPASSETVRIPLTGVTVRSPNQGLRLGLSRLARVKPLHPSAVPH